MVIAYYNSSSKAILTTTVTMAAVGLGFTPFHVRRGLGVYPRGHRASGEHRVL